MKYSVKNFSIIILFPILFIRRIYYWHKTEKSKLPGIQFAAFGFNIARKLFFKGKIVPRLLLNPVSIVRYFEFDFANKNFQSHNEIKVLDVSSPYLFGFYQISKNSLEYNYINPDLNDLSNVISLSEKINNNLNYKIHQMNVLELAFPNEYFDRVISISVIEHILDNGDSAAMREIWRVLKPGGDFILTLPVKKEFEIEYRDRDEYNLNPEKKSDLYFFQRIYDNQKIQERLLSSITNYEILSIEVFGCDEKEFYTEYKRRWMKFSYWETVKDPYYISTKFSCYNNINELKDIGVIGLTIKKLK